jgi:quercetin dioxygenase-like cupin family protein
MLAARVVLHKGCEVKVHHHPSEQIAMIMSGRVRWTLGEDGRQVEVGPGEVVHLPANVPHGVYALEDTLIFDILSPPGAMGVDTQDAH